jgi:hypothetical protein
MNQALQLSREYLLIKKYWYEHKRSYGILFLAFTAFLFIVMAINLVFSNPMLFRIGSQILYYFIGLFLFGCLSGSLLFSELGTKSKAINYLLTPASAIEKLVCLFLFGVIVFFVGYSLTFSIVNSIVVALANHINSTDFEVVTIFNILRYNNPMTDRPNSELLIIFFTVQAAFIMGSIYFSSYSLLKTIIVLGLLWAFAIVFISFIANAILPAPGWFKDQLHTFEILHPSGKNKLIIVPHWIGSVCTLYFQYMIIPVLWAAIYYRLKEKQV